VFSFAITGILLIPAGASAVEHPFLETLGSASEPTFTKAEGLAVDQSSGALLVIDGEEATVSRWNPDGTPADFSALGSNIIDGSETPEGELSFNGSNGGPGEVQVAVDNSGMPSTDGRIYVPQFTISDVVQIFAPDGSYLGQLTESSEGVLSEPCGVAVDSGGNLYVGDFSGHIHKFANPPVNGESTDFPFSGSCTMAAGAAASDGFVFPAHFFGSIAKLNGTTGEGQYTVDPGPTTTATVDPSTGILYTASGGEVKEFDVSGETEATPLTPILGEDRVMGIAVSGASGNIYVAREGSPHIEVYGPAAELPEAFTEVASIVDGKVTLHGTANAAAGSAATCVFQYVEVKAEGFKGATSVPCSPAGPFIGNNPVSVSAVISGLPEAAYRFRLLVSNEDASKAGEELFFDTFEKIPGLPDNRAYEMISPPQKAGEVLPPEPNTQLGGSCGDCLPGENSPVMPMQSTPDGEAVLYLGQPFFGGLSSGPNEYVAPRSASGWGVEGLSSSVTTGDYVGFSSSLSRGVLTQVEPPLSPQAPTRGGKAFRNLFLREGSGAQPLVTEEPPNRNPREPGEFKIRFATANAGTAFEPGFSHLLFEANDALTKEVPGIAPAAPKVDAGGNCTDPGVECNLYEWQEGELALVNVLPENEDAAAGAVIGVGRLLNQFQAPDVSHAISDDGSRIFFSAQQTGQVYVRVNGEETLEIPGPELCKESVPLSSRVCFLTASADGTSVLLSDGQVYELNGAETAYEPTVDLTEGEGGFEGILGAAEDLSRVYFVDTEELTEDAEDGKLNLYAWDEGTLSFIGMLVADDREFNPPRYGTWTASPSHRVAQVTSDGSWLAFMSLAQLTGYDNTRRGGGNCRSSQTPACREVFVYSVDSDTLSCASCNPSGQRPLGDSNLSLIVPNRTADAPPFPQPGNLARDGSGRLFFESQDVLSTRDINGNIQDIYQWEPQDVGSCERASGCVSLISSGASPTDSMFLDSSHSGNDAFFITRQQLLPRDKDEQLDLYDARVGGGFDEPSEESCGGEACAGPIASPPAQLTPGTPSFRGPGNPPKPKPRHCKKGFVKKHGKCVKKKSKKHRSGGSK
jgi:hypothetical protein